VPFCLRKMGPHSVEVGAQTPPGRPPDDRAVQGVVPKGPGQETLRRGKVTVAEGPNPLLTSKQNSSDQPGFLPKPVAR
jgi:hypothetical protein